MLSAFDFADQNYVFLPEKYTWPSSHPGMYSHIHFGVIKLYCISLGPAL